MKINLDDSKLTDQERKLIFDNILSPMIKKISKANILIKDRCSALGLDKDEEIILYSKFKLNIKKLEININKNNLIKII